MKRRKKLLVLGAAIFVGATLLTGCTNTFCSPNDKAHILYCFDYGVCWYYDAENKPTEEGLKDACNRGMIAGFPVIDIKATLYDGSYHDVDSSEAAYKIAASMALKEAAKKCSPVILEPIMKIEVTVPEQYYTRTYSPARPAHCPPIL